MINPFSPTRSRLKGQYFAAIILSIAFLAFSLPLKAQSVHSSSKIEIAQSSDGMKNEALDKKARSIIMLLLDKNYSQVIDSLSPQLAEKLTSEDLQRITVDLINKTGSVKKLGESTVINTINADLVVINTDFENTQGEFIVIFNKKQEIVGIDFPKVDSIDTIAEIFVNSLAQGDYVRARGYLHPFLKTELFPQQVQGKWEALIKRNGPVKKILETEVRVGSTVDQVDLVTVKIEFEKATQEIFIIFDEEKRIVGIDTPTIN